MVEDSSSKRITRGIHLHDNIMGDSSSFSLGITQEVEAIAGSLARARASEEVRSKHRNDPISKRMSSRKKRKADEIASSSGELEKKDGSVSDNEDDNEIGENEGVQYIIEGTPIVTQRMKCYININVMDDLTKTLTESQMRRFRETTCFSYLLDMNRCNVQAQLFRCFMLFEVRGSSSDAFIIHVNGFTLRFTRRGLLPVILKE